MSMRSLMWIEVQLGPRGISECSKNNTKDTLLWHDEHQ